MATLGRIRSGYKSRSAGLKFELYVRLRAEREGIEVIQLPLGAKQLKNKLIRVQMPCDFIMSKNKQTILFDAKSTLEVNFAFSQITTHQVEQLYRQELQGITAGYLVYFQQLDCVSFFRAGKLRALKQRESLKGIADACYTAPRSEFKMIKIFDLAGASGEACNESFPGQFSERSRI